VRHEAKRLIGKTRLRYHRPQPQTADAVPISPICQKGDTSSFRARRASRSREPPRAFVFKTASPDVPLWEADILRKIKNIASSRLNAFGASGWQQMSCRPAKLT